MKFCALFLCLISVCMVFAASYREQVLFDSDWRFKLDDAPGKSLDTQTLGHWLLPTSNPFFKDPGNRHVNPVGEFGSDLPYTHTEFDDGSWRHLDLPHDWGIAGPFTHEGGGGMGRLPCFGVGWYRKNFEVPASDGGRRIYMDFDGAMSYAAVWINGKFAGGWPFGYTSWRLDITQFLHVGGKNVVAVRLYNPGNSSRWYTGAGIYRHVWIVKTSPIHVGHWGTSLTTPVVSAKAASVALKVVVDNDSSADTVVTAKSEIFSLDRNGKRSGRAIARASSVGAKVSGQGSAAVEQVLEIENPLLWGPPPTQQPNRYVAVTTVFHEGTVVDRFETPFGIRSIKFTAANGLLVNGERVDLKGVCLHHDLGAIGTAFNESAMERQIDTLIEMGANAIRTSHNPPAPELLEYCDAKGILVLDESTDVWMAPKTPFDYHLLFEDWHEQDLRALIRRDRNHPSVVMWSIGNEVGEQFRGEAGARIARILNDIAHDEDPTRPTTTAMNAARADSPFAAVVDLIGLNYQGTGVRSGPAQYPVFHAKYPEKFVYGSETTSTISSRGEYTFPVATGFGVPSSAKAGEDVQRRQLSSYDLYSAPWSYSPDKEFQSQEKWQYVGGEFVWTGFDYIGEPTPFDTSRSSYFGIIDLAGFKKDRFYLYQAHWRPESPMAHILPHWTWPERTGQVTPVHVYTSGDEGELFLNGKSLGRKKKGQFEYRLRWDDVEYEPGTLKVVTYKKGQPWATDTMATAGPAARLRLTPDRRSITGNGHDLCYLTLSVEDEHGLTVPRSHPRIAFTVEGPGEIVATDNGDPTNFDSFVSHDREAFNGLALVIVRALPGQAGRIRVRAIANGIRSATADIRSSRSK